MGNEPGRPTPQNLQKTYQNTLKFRPGQSVHVYIGGAKHSFQNVASLVVDTVHSLLTILTPTSNTLFCNWDGIEVGKGQSADFVVSSGS